MSSAFDKLNPKQRIFVRQYMTHFNAARAAREAGYKESNANNSGHKLLRRPRIMAAIAEMLDAEGITPERIKAEFAQIAFGCDPADVEDYLNGKVSLQELRDRGVDTRLIHEASVTAGDSGETRKVKLHDRMKALSELARVYGMVNPTSGQQVPVFNLVLNVKEKKLNA